MLENVCNLIQNIHQCLSPAPPHQKQSGRVNTGCNHLCQCWALIGLTSHNTVCTSHQQTVNILSNACKMWNWKDSLGKSGDMYAAGKQFHLKQLTIITSDHWTHVLDNEWGWCYTGNLKYNGVLFFTVKYLMQILFWI